MLDLNTLVAPSALHLVCGLSINDRGEIAGRGVPANGNVHAFLLVPTDEAQREGLSSNAPAAGTLESVTPQQDTPVTWVSASPWRARIVYSRGLACPGA